MSNVMLLRKRMQLRRQRNLLVSLFLLLVVAAFIINTSGSAEKTPTMTATVVVSSPQNANDAITVLYGKDFIPMEKLEGEDWVANFDRINTNPTGNTDTVWNDVPNEDRGQNPSVAEVVQYAFAHASNHTAPPEVPLTVCFWESGGLKQYAADGSITQGDNGSSIDWGICQINDVYKSADLVAMAKSDWKQSFEAGWIVLDSCWNSWGSKSIEAVIACHHAPGDVYYDMHEYGYIQRARPVNYLNYVMPIWRGKYWNQYK